MPPYPQVPQPRRRGPTRFSPVVHRSTWSRGQPGRRHPYPRSLGVPFPGPCDAFWSLTPFFPRPLTPTHLRTRACAPPATERLGCSELSPAPEAFCALPLPSRPTLSYSCSVAFACVSFPINGAPLAYLSPQPFAYLIHHICRKIWGRSRFKTPGQL